ncbi:MAG TPA: hypothetical protein DEA55_01730 [Rhodospirillaceae bacterium]|nr:hypothetical protein [Rhodospirillaceae bacterium]
MPNFVPRWMLPVLAASLLTACAGVNSNPITACPPIKEYSREFQRKLADEIEAASPSAAFIIMLQDYQSLRLLLKSCS